MIVVLKNGILNVEGVWEKRVGRVIVGALGVLLILVLRMVLLDRLTDDSVAGYSIRYPIAALASLWVIALSPMLFVKLRLANRQNI
jgi:hypothetical protein